MCLLFSLFFLSFFGQHYCLFLRFRHFEELHRRLKEFPEYNLHLPPKHFLSTGLDVPVIQERCELLDKYLKVKLTHFFFFCGGFWGVGGDVTHFFGSSHYPLMRHYNSFREILCGFSCSVAVSTLLLKTSFSVPNCFFG